MIELLLGGLIEPPKQPLIELTNETKIEIQIPELTIEDKIKSNFYNCNTNIEWIRADTAECLPKQVIIQPKAKNQFKTIKNSSRLNLNSPPLSWWDYHSCTWHVASKRTVGFWNSASNWLWQAKRDGYSTGSAPRAGAIGWTSGHVVYIESVDGNKVYISERNYDYNGSYRERWANASEFTYIY